MRLDLFMVENVKDFDAVRFEIVGNQRAMASPPDCFGAQDGGWPVFRRYVRQALDPLAKIFRLHVIRVTPERRVSPRGVF